MRGGILPTGLTPGMPLYRFSVSNGSAANVGLRKATFKQNKVNVNTSNFRLYNSSGNLVSFISEAGGPVGEILELYLAETISAGNTNTYTLTADVECPSPTCAGSGGSGSLSIQMLGDGAFPIPLPTNYDNVNQGPENKFIWTDFWQTPVLGFSAPNATTTNQWSSGYLVPLVNGSKLPSTSTAVVFTR